MIRPAWLLASLACAVLLGARVLWAGEDGRLWELFAEARFGGVSWQLVRGLAWVAAAATLPFALLGGLCRLAAGGRRGGFGALAGFGVGLVLAGALTWVIAGVEAPGGWTAPAVVELLLPAVGCVIGVLLGGAFGGSPSRVVRSLVGRLAALGAAAVIVLGAVATRSLGETVPNAPVAEVTSEQKRALVSELRRHNPFKLAEDARGHLALAPAQLESLLAWGALLIDDQARVSVRGDSEGLGWLASVRLPFGFGGRRQLNLAGELAAASGPGGLHVELCTLSVGTLEVAPALCRSILQSLYRAMRSSREFGAVTHAIAVLRVDGAGLAATYTRPAMDKQSRRHLQQAFGPGSEIREAARAQFEALRDQGPVIAAGDDRLAAIVRATFELARRRSDSGSAVAQNQGAILALATILGHPDVATLAGIERPGEWQAIRQTLEPAPLRGRDDWTRHFLVSAGLTQISTAVMSDAAGLLKEELDAARRSGFSFADLLADRAGTRFGELAARDEATARGLQQLVLAEGFRVDDLMPPADDLPEGLSDEALNSRYGGVHGPGYQALVALIEDRVRRLPTLDILRPR